MTEQEGGRCVYLGLPAFNEELAIYPLFGRVRSVRAELLARLLTTELRVIVYDDGSTDATAEQVRLHSGGLEVSLLSPKSNGGLGVAMRGLITQFLDQAQKDDVLVVMDADDTHDPNQIIELLTVMDEGEKDVVIASRYRRGSRVAGVPAYRQILSLGFGVLVGLMLPISGVRDYSCGYRAYTYRALAKVANESGFPIQESGFASMPEILIRLRGNALSFGEIPLKLAYDRRLTVSKMRAWQNSRRLLSRIFSWRVFPKRLNNEPFVGLDSRIWWETQVITSKVTD